MQHTLLLLPLSLDAALAALAAAAAAVAQVRAELQLYNHQEPGTTGRRHGCYHALLHKVV
jgi:hypothetical protein